MTWRLLHHPPASGAWNMAVDEAILLHHAATDSPPTLRFYGWQPVCVSIGRFQKVAEEGNPDASDTFAAPLAGGDWVRRPTGGRAVLHQHEVTYSVVLREDLLPAGSHSVLGAYRWLSEGLVAGLSRLGVQAALGHAAPQPPGEGRANCFTSAARCDLVVDSRKLIGSAQCRKQGAVLQHGSLLLDLDQKQWSRSVGGSMTGATTLRSLGLVVGEYEVRAALIAGVEEALGVSLVEGTLNPREIQMAEGLHNQKYATHAWNRFGKPEMW